MFRTYSRPSETPPIAPSFTACHFWLASLSSCCPRHAWAHTDSACSPSRSSIHVSGDRRRCRPESHPRNTSRSVDERFFRLHAGLRWACSDPSHALNPPPCRKLPEVHVLVRGHHEHEAVAERGQKLPDGIDRRGFRPAGFRDRGQGSGYCSVGVFEGLQERGLRGLLAGIAGRA